MNKFHSELLEEVKRHTRKVISHSVNDSYLSSGHKYYSVAVPLKREVVKRWANCHKDILQEEYIALLNSLYLGDSYEEKTMGSLLLEYLPNQRQHINPKILSKWLNVLTGWAEIDSLSQSNFTAKEMLSNWNTWRALIKEFCEDNSLSKRRASLVLLTGPVSHSEDKKLSELAFEVIERLQMEKDILITKAISWLLRSLIKYHRNEVKDYLSLHHLNLPRVAVRETQRKLLTGKK